MYWKQHSKASDEELMKTNYYCWPYFKDNKNMISKRTNQKWENSLLTKLDLESENEKQWQIYDQIK